MTSKNVTHLWTLDAVDAVSKSLVRVATSVPALVPTATVVTAGLIVLKSNSKS